jgi:hypothetical protein
MNRIAVSLFTLALALAFSSGYGLAAQSRCALTESNAPTIRGLRLGMTFDQVVALFPGSSRRKEMRDAIEKAKAAPAGEVAYLGFDAASDGAKDQFAGIDSVQVGLSKGRVVDFTVQYVGPSWSNIDEWVTKLSETLGLPGKQEWVVGPNENPNKILKCKGVEIEAATQGGGSSIRVHITEPMAGGTGSGEEGKRKVFKP